MDEPRLAVDGDRKQPGFRPDKSGKPRQPQLEYGARMAARSRRGAVAWAVALLLAVAWPAGADDVPAKPPAAPKLRLLYFHASWCEGCRRFEAGRVLERLQARHPTLTVEKVDVQAKPELLERYGVELTPTVLLVDEHGTRLGKLRIALKDPDATLERAEALVTSVH